MEANGIPIMALVDSGSTISVIHPSVLDRIQRGHDVTLVGDMGQLRVADGRTVETHGVVQLSLRVGTDPSPVLHEMVVAEMDAPAIMGIDFMMLNHCILDANRGTLIFNGRTHHCRVAQRMPQTFHITVRETTELPPMSEMIIPGLLHGRPHFIEGIVEPCENSWWDGNLALAKMIVEPTRGEIPLRVANFSDQPQRLYEGAKIATCEAVKRVHDYLSSNQEKSSVNPNDPLSTTADRNDDQPDNAATTGSVTGETTDNLVNGVVLGGQDETKIPEHMTTLVDEEILDRNQGDMAAEMLLEFIPLFAKSKDDLTVTDFDMHSMKMKSEKTIKQGLRRMPLARRRLVKEELQRMLRLGIIEPSYSSWASPIVLVEKKDGTIRFCVDFRLVNDLLVKDSYPLPRIDDSIDALRGSQWFSTLDLQSGYWQLPMDPKDKDKTAFITPFGLYQFKVLPFGLASAPATFERLMEKVLSGLHWEICLVYLDDIIIFSRSFEDHVARLRIVLTRLRDANLKLSPKKCRLFRREVHFLGHVVSNRGVETDPAKIEAVVAWPRPRNLKEVRSFLGLCSYYRRFVKGFSTIAKPLHQLTEKDRKFLWTLECEEAFLALKAALTTPPVLGYPAESGSYILDADASAVGIGAVLSQIQDGTERVIAYYSSTLEHRERQYCVTRRELLAIVKSVKHFHPYLYGRHFLIRTDHGSLQWLLRFKNQEGQMARWLSVLELYDFEIKHRPGVQHSNADGLSRRPCQGCHYCEKREQRSDQLEELSPCPRVCHLTSPDILKDQWVTPWTPEQISCWQREDPILDKVITWINAGRKPPWSAIQAEGSELRSIWSCYQQLKLVNGVLQRSVTKAGKSVEQLVAPQAVRDQIFQFLHTGRLGGHLGIKRTVASARRRFWWPGMKRDVARWIQHCDVCQRRTRRPGPGRAPLCQSPVGSPMERIAFDILSFPEPTEDGNTCVLVVCDYFTKWSEAFALEDHKAATVADVLVTEIFLKLGVPRFIHSDQAPEFMSELMTELHELLEIQRTRTCPYRPQSDGLVERLNRTLIDMLSKFCNENLNDWDNHLPYLISAYRATRNESTQCSPNLLMLGREITFPVDLVYPDERERDYQCPVSYVEWVRRAMRENFEKAREHLGRAAERQKRNYDERAEPRKFNIGDWILRFYPPNLRNKLNPIYIGPYEVVAKPGVLTYSLRRPGERKCITVHVDHLKKYWRPEDLRETESADESSADLPLTDLFESESDSPDEEDPVSQPQPADESRSHPSPRRSHRRRRPPAHFANYELNSKFWFKNLPRWWETKHYFEAEFFFYIIL